MRHNICLNKWLYKNKCKNVKILYDITFSHTPSGVSELYRTFSSDLRKPCCKLVKACLLIKYLVLFVRKPIITYSLFSHWFFILCHPLKVITQSRTVSFLQGYCPAAFIIILLVAPCLFLMEQVGFPVDTSDVFPQLLYIFGRSWCGHQIWG